MSIRLNRVIILSMNKTIFSGIQPSGKLHLGNYLGMIRQMVAEQKPGETMLLGIVDLHAITVPQNPKELREKCIELAALYIACGIDPKKSKIMIQSENPDHAYLAWVFDCITPMGWLERMTQYKDKSTKAHSAEASRARQGGNIVSVGLLSYPALMAADILLYDSPYVPVGEDQTQHIEFTRDIAERFNKQFGDTFTLPKAKIMKEGARIMSLQNPLSKMSKSDNDPTGTINLLDNLDEIRKKVKRAVTDSGAEITYSTGKPALSNLLTIYSLCSGKPVDEIEAMYTGKGYADFKTDLAEVVVTVLKPIQVRYEELRKDESYLNKVLDDGREYATSISSKKIVAVKQAVGLGR